MCQRLAALLAPRQAAAAALSIVERLHARGSDDATVQAVRLFAHTVESMPAEVVEQEAPLLLERWADHRDFSVREVGSGSCSCCCCLMLVTGLHVVDMCAGSCSWSCTQDYICHGMLILVSERTH